MSFVAVCCTSKTYLRSRPRPAIVCHALACASPMAKGVGNVNDIEHRLIRNTAKQGIPFNTILKITERSSATVAKFVKRTARVAFLVKCKGGLLHV